MSALRRGSVPLAVFILFSVALWVGSSFISKENNGSEEGNAVGRRLQMPHPQGGGGGAGGGASLLLPYIVPVIFPIIYYFLVVTKFQKLPEGTVAPQEAMTLQAESTPCICMKTSVSNCLLAFCCFPARASHTLHVTNTLNYWVACIAIACCPCCVTCWSNACTDMNNKLGAEQENVFFASLCAFFCMPCVVLKDAQALDIVMQKKTGCCGVEDA